MTKPTEAMIDPIREAAAFLLWYKDRGKNTDDCVEAWDALRKAIRSPTEITQEKISAALSPLKVEGPSVKALDRQALTDALNEKLVDVNTEAYGPSRGDWRFLRTNEIVDAVEAFFSTLVEHDETAERGETPPPVDRLRVTGFRGSPLRVVLSSGHEATVTQKLIDSFASPSPFNHVVFDMSDEEIGQWIDACNHEPAKASLRHYLALRTPAPAGNNQILATQGEGQ